MFRLLEKVLDVEIISYPFFAYLIPIKYYDKFKENLPEPKGKYEIIKGTGHAYLLRGLHWYMRSYVYS